MGVGTAPADNTPVALEPCGVSAKTVWFQSSGQSLTAGGYEPLINGGTDTSFANPDALTDLKPGGDRQLFTWPLGSGGILHNKFANQLWRASFGVLPSS